MKILPDIEHYLFKRLYAPVSNRYSDILLLKYDMVYDISMLRAYYL